MKKVQIFYPKTTSGKIISQRNTIESEIMHNYGFMVGSDLSDNADLIIYRGYTIYQEEKYPKDKRFLNGWNQNANTLFMSRYLPCIEPWTMDTFIVQDLKKSDVIAEIQQKGWKKAFIKQDSLALTHIKDNGSVWPDTSLEWMLEQYNSRHMTGPYAIREFINNPQIFYDEQRYWVLKGIAHHPSGEIPEFVQEAANRLYIFSGSHYFTMDVAGEYIVEVNPGESSDRGGDNPLDWFCKIFADAFLQ